MAGEKPIGGNSVAVFAPAFCQHKFVRGLQHGKASDAFQVAGIGVRRERGPASSTSPHGTSPPSHGRSTARRLLLERKVLIACS